MSVDENFYCENGRSSAMRIVTALHGENKDVWHRFSARKSNVGIIIFPSAQYCVRALHDALSLMRADYIPRSIDVIYIIPEEVLPIDPFSRINVVDKILSWSGNTVLYDESGRRPAKIPHMAMSVEDGKRLIVDARKVDIDESNREKRVAESRMNANVLFVDTTMTCLNKDLDGHPVDEAVRHVSDSYRLLTGGRVPMPMSLEEIADTLYTMTSDTEKPLVEMMARGARCFLVDEQTREHRKRIREAYELVTFARRAVERAISYSHLPIEFDTAYAADGLCDEGHIRRMDVEPLMALFEAIGAYSMLDAYLDGTPEEDILA